MTGEGGGGEGEGGSGQRRYSHRDAIGYSFL